MLQLPQYEELISTEKALLLRSQMLRLSRPNDRVLDVFSNWFNQMKPFSGVASRLLEETSDLVALGIPEEQDRLSRIIRDVGGRCLPAKSNPGVNEVKYYSEETSRKVVAGISIIMAALLLEGAIIALYFVTDPHLRLGLIALFMVLFAGGIGLLSNAKRSEMFAATAAYAAVLVVFVSGNLGSRS